MKTILQSIRMLLALTVLTGVCYPLAVTFFAYAGWSGKATGSIVTVNNTAIGSELLAQKMEDARYFWPRPSAADYATVASGASNLGPSSATLQKVTRERAAKWRESNSLAGGETVPGDMLFASGSGLDPHISVLAAKQQIQRVATARNLSPESREKLEKLVQESIEPPQFGLFGEPRVNVLMLNLAANRLFSPP